MMGAAPRREIRDRETKGTWQEPASGAGSRRAQGRPADLTADFMADLILELVVHSPLCVFASLRRWSPHVQMLVTGRPAYPG